MNMTVSKTVPKMRPIHATLTLNPYGRTIDVVCAETLKEAAKVYCKKNGPDAIDGIEPKDEKSAATTIRLVSGDAVIFFNYNYLSCVDIVHEVEHAVNHIFAYVGLEWSHSGCEAFAYMKDSVFERIVKTVEKSGLVLPLYR